MCSGDCCHSRIFMLADLSAESRVAAPPETLAEICMTFSRSIRAALPFCSEMSPVKESEQLSLVANLQASIRSQPELARSPVKLLDRVNRLFFEFTGPEHYATLFFGICEQTRTIRYVNCGHPAQFCCVLTARLNFWIPQPPCWARSTARFCRAECFFSARRLVGALFRWPDGGENRSAGQGLGC